MEKPYLTQLSQEELLEWFEQQGERAFRLKQVQEWLYQKAASSWEDLSNLSRATRSKLHCAFRFPKLKLLKVEDSADGQTKKFLWEMEDGQRVESVLIESGIRRTLCVSSQIGCRARCSFCASGKLGLARNLEAHEIINQLLSVNQFLKERGERITHVVFMGMGEPLENFENVVKTIRTFTDPQAVGISARRITVSTVGLPDMIQKLADEDLRVNLVLSLHGSSQKSRKRLIPYARKYELSEILFAMRYYSRKSKRDITYEYTLVENVNDSPDHAEELADLIGRDQCTVNLIPLNPVPGVNLTRPSTEAIQRFRSVLTRRNVVNTCRYTKGKDIAAACGQLALQESNRS